ncbi:MAG: DUF4244 domain-containing protein [Demequina sp.]
MKKWIDDRAGGGWDPCDDDGMATTEYALVTVAAAAFAGVLIALVRSQEVRELLAGILRSAFG